MTTKERPILFSAPMVLALLNGSKTQTRRIVKPQPPSGHSLAGFCSFSMNPADVDKAVWSGGPAEAALIDPHRVRCPYGQRGDRLWVKETWRPHVAHGCVMGSCDCGDLNITYAADGHIEHARDGTIPADWTLPKAAATGNVSPFFMPRWASRLTLEITAVRVRRLQDINRVDAEAEGCAGGHGSIPDYNYSAIPQEHFMHVWNAINGASAWNENPWVWALTFQRVQPNA